MARGAWLGFIFFVALVLLGFGTILVGRLELFGRRELLEVHFPTAGGLRPGDEVRVDGMRFGEVRDIRLAPDRVGVVATLSLREPIELYEGMKIEVQSLALLGGNFVAIHRGDPKRGRFRGQPPYEGSLGAGPFDFSALEKIDFSQVASALNRIADAATQGEGTIPLLLRDREVYDRLNETLADMQQTFRSFREGEGTIPALVNDPAMRDRVRSALENADASLARLRELVDRAGREDTTLGRLMSSDELYREVRSAFETLRTSFEEIRDVALHGEGAVATLMTDRQVAENLREALRAFRETATNLEDVTGKVRRGEGTLGRLVTDEQLIEQAQGALQGVQQTFGRISQTVLQVRAGFNRFVDREYSTGYAQVRIWPDENKMFLIGATVFLLDDDGDVPYEDIATESREEEFRFDAQVGWRLPWLLDRRLLFRGGIVEGRPGAAFEWDPDHPLFRDQRLRFTLEGRQSYTSVRNDDFDERAGGTLVRAFVTTPLWHRSDDFLGVVLGHMQLHAGVNSILDDPEVMVGIGVEYPDQDIRTLLGLIGLSR